MASKDPQQPDSHATGVPADKLAGERVWVLDDPRADSSGQAIGIAERLGVPHRRISLSWTWFAGLATLSPRGSLFGLAPSGRGVGEHAMPADAAGSLLALAPGGAGPSLVISTGSRAAGVALWLKGRVGAHVVHCLRPGFMGIGLMGAGLSGGARIAAFDLLVVPEHEYPPRADNVMPVLGVPHRLSPMVLRQAEQAWRERLAHLPRPRVALLVGGPGNGTDMPPALAHGLGRAVARLTAAQGGSVLATTSRRTGTEAADALAAGLSRVMHLLHRWDEPDESPYVGFLASADAVVVTSDSLAMLSEACATSAPVYAGLPELASWRQRRLLGALYEAGLARPLGHDLSPWPRRPLDEAGRVAAEILRRIPLE